MVMTYQINHLIPENYVGKPTNLSLSVILPSLDEALICFNRATKRLLNPPVWHKLSGWTIAHFQLSGPGAEELDRLAEEGDYFRIDVTGAGRSAGNGYDWVNVEKINLHVNPTGTSEWTFLKMRPCSDPRKPEQGTAHFFTSIATSSYIVERNGNIVTGRYHGRNEIPSTATDSKLDYIRNVNISTGAAMGFSEVQWTALLKGLLSAEIGA
jgi:hypothetical protein